MSDLVCLDTPAPKPLPPQEEVIKAAERTARLLWPLDTMLRISAVQRSGTSFYRITMLSPLRRVRFSVDRTHACADLTTPGERVSRPHETASTVIADALDLKVGLPR